MVDTLLLLAVLAIAIPFIGMLLCIICKRPAARFICVIASAISFAFCLATWLMLAGEGGQEHVYTLISVGETAIFGIIVDRMSVMLTTCFVGIGLLISIYSCAYFSPKNAEHPDEHRRRFYSFMIAFIGAMAGIVFSSTIIGQLIFFEITGACSWSLIGYYNNEQSRKSAMKALIITHIASLGLYIGGGALFLQTGTFDVHAIAQLDDFWKTFVVIFIVIAAWGKSAQLPMYMWLPSAMVAPTPVSAYLHGASMVKVGVCVLARTLLSAGAVPEPVGWVVVIGGIVTLVFSFIMYLPQNDMKRLLAFSTISQLSYMFLAFGFCIFGSDVALNGGIAHIFNHAFAKTLLFLVAGAVAFTMGTRLMTKLKGLFSKMPLLAVSFVIGSLAIAGVPPLSGFFSKFLIFVGGFQAASITHSVLLVIIVIVALAESVCCFAWFLKWISSIVPGEPSETVAKAQPLPKQMVVVFIILIVMTFCSSGIAAAWLG